ncbi:P-loop NTPase fold protein [uncultured Helicobacter sp.]|uniref:KAP family P-loop NTPase fold protein n=1 Tax=uncultured Helicobacter sp. TaxID=175537 RepID=UPI002630501C|nr:P-loop NTPase fold protein [uncultured Helicobacter sp.]
MKGLFNKIGIDNELLQEASQTLTENAAVVLIENYSKEKECLVQLKENLTKVFEATGVKEGQPFIIFIDEIDRCRPTYAIEMLENIKHLFGIPNLVFVISIDKAQLSKSIQAIYGQIDTENYLRRFFDLEFILPNPSPQRFCEYLQEKLEIQTNLAEIFIADNFALRELQKILPQIKLLEMQQFQDNNKEPIFDMQHAIFILLIKIYRPDLYLQIPNITDAEGIMGIVEKLVCKERFALKDSPLIEYIEAIYGVCPRLYAQDSFFIENINLFHQDSSNKWYIIKNGETISVSLNQYSYIVQTYCDWLKHRGYLKISWNKHKIITAINFTSQFTIQDKSNNRAINPTP